VLLLLLLLNIFTVESSVKGWEPNMFSFDSVGIRPYLKAITNSHPTRYSSDNYLRMKITH
jgi:hypothetical protein